jgi:HAD superfamily hydrolase (TIGR01484 family)
MKLVLSDFDGTLTINGKLGAVFFDLIDLINKNDSSLVIVSGRSLSWGHFFVTHFPIKHVVMEGGGVIVSKNREGHIVEQYLISNEEIKQLETLTAKLCEQIPEVVLSVDSFGRKTDRAIEFSQMSKNAVDKTEAFLLKEGANFSRSNVHINFWVGEISKSRGVQTLMKEQYPHISSDQSIFYGDALKDESMFKDFQNSVGVSNIISVLDELEYKPKIILEGKENAGANGVLAHLKEVFDQSADF